MDREAVLKRLGEPFPKAAVKQREGGRGKMLDYVETHTVIHRLNDVCPEWSFTIKSLTPHTAPDTRNGEPQTMWIAVGALTIPGLGTREGIGVQTAGEKSEDLVKGAGSDCLKKCAVSFGVAIELYGPDYEGNHYQPLMNAVPVGQPSLAQQVRREPPVKNDGEPPDEPCEVPGCELVCAGKFVGFSRRTYDLVLCAKHSKRAKEGALDLDAVKYEIASGIHVDHNRHDPDDARQDAPGDTELHFRDWTAFYAYWKPLGVHNAQDMARRTGRTDFDLSDMTPDQTHALLMEAS